MTLPKITVTAANEVTLQAASDHGYPVLWIANIALVDLRRDYPSPRYKYRTADRVRFVSLHHDAVFYSAPPDPDDTFITELRRINAVQTYHVEQGWGGIGYHTYGFPSGRLYYVGDFNTQRANVAGRNHESIGHCTAGDWSEQFPPVASQLVAAMAVLAAWKHIGQLVEILPHKRAALASSPTSCPGLTQWIDQLPRAIEAIARQRAQR